MAPEVVVTEIQYPFSVAPPMSFVATVRFGVAPKAVLAPIPVIERMRNEAAATKAKRSLIVFDQIPLRLGILTDY